MKGDAVVRQITVVKSEGNLSKPLPRRPRRFRAFRVGNNGVDWLGVVSGSPCGADAEDAEIRFAGRGKGWERETFGQFNRTRPHFHHRFLALVVTAFTGDFRPVFWYNVIMSLRATMSAKQQERNRSERSARATATKPSCGVLRYAEICAWAQGAR